MANITLPGLPAKIGTIDNAALLHLNESGVDKKVTISDVLAKIAAQYQSFMQTFLLTSNKAAARLALDITRRTTFSNADYSIVETDKVVSQIGTLSAPRTLTLPAANTVPAGEELIIVDDSGTATTTNKIIVSRAGSDTIDGATSKDITLAYGILRLVCDGVSKWKIVNSEVILQKRILLSNNITDPANDLDSAFGTFDFDDGTGRATLPAGTGQLDVLFGTGNGMLDVGTIANTTYHIFAIYNPVNSIAKLLASTSLASPTMPSGFTKKARIMSIKRVSAALQLFDQFDKTFYLRTQVEDRALAAPPATPVLLTTSLPSGISLMGIFNCYIETGSSLPNSILIANPNSTTTASTSTHNLRVVSSSASACSYNLIQVPTNSSAQVSVDAVSTNGSLQVITQGWIDFSL